MVSFQIEPKGEILICLRLREMTELDEVGNHALSILLLPHAGSPKAAVDVQQHARQRAPRPPLAMRPTLTMSHYN